MGRIWTNGSGLALNATNLNSLENDLGRAVKPWTANTNYGAGQAVIDPNGNLVTANAIHTSGASFTAANWSTPYDAAVAARVNDRTSQTRAAMNANFAGFSSVRRNLKGTAPALAKYTGNPVFTVGAQGSTFSTIQWPWIVNVVADTGTTGQFGETYRLYYSTDHENSTARIGLLTATDRTGPWTDRGQVYRDTTSGNQTETQAVVWNPAEQLWFMYYHQVGVTGTTAPETTLLATSPNGVDTWTRVGVILDYPADDLSGYPPNPGIGYFRPFRIGNRWYAHALLAGGDYARFLLAQSPDGRKWTIDPRPLGNMSEMAGNGYRIEWNSGTVIFWNGEYYWVGLVSNFTSGGVGRVTKYVAATISPDFRKITAPPITLFPTLQTWETSPADNRSGGSLLVDTDGSLVLAYSGGTQGFGIATGV
jgi:hypothetical protein